MRFILALIVVLGLAVQALSQSTSGTGTWSTSFIPSVSTSLSHTGSYPTPPAPLNLRNRCLSHIINICPGWDIPTGFDYNVFKVHFALQGSGVIQTVVVNRVSTRITNLVPGALYDVMVQGVDTHFGVYSFNSTTIIMQTDPSDPKYDPTKDIQNFACAQGLNPVNNRIAIFCTWTAAQDVVRQINFKVKCSSTVRDPVFIRKRVFGAKAQLLEAKLAINRDIATCNVYARFYYARRPTSRHSVTLTIFD